MRLSVVPDLEGREEVWQGVRDPDQAQDRPFRRRVGAHQLERRGLDLGQPARDVDEDREEDQDRHDHHLGQRVEHAEPVVHERREGDDRDRARPDRDRQQQLAGGHETGGQEGDDDAGGRPDGQPAERLEEGRRRRRPERPAAGSPVVAERGHDLRSAPGAGSRGSRCSGRRPPRARSSPTKTTIAGR